MEEGVSRAESDFNDTLVEWVRAFKNWQFKYRLKISMFVVSLFTFRTMWIYDFFSDSLANSPSTNNSFQSINSINDETKEITKMNSKVFWHTKKMVLSLEGFVGFYLSKNSPRSCLRTVVATKHTCFSCSNDHKTYRITFLDDFKISAD